jgi:hypothetical protein
VTTGDYVIVWSSQGQNGGTTWDVYMQTPGIVGSKVFRSLFEPFSLLLLGRVKIDAESRTLWWRLRRYLGMTMIWGFKRRPV